MPDTKLADPEHQDANLHQQILRAYTAILGQRRVTEDYPTSENEYTLDRMERYLDILLGEKSTRLVSRRAMMSAR